MKNTNSFTYVNGFVIESSYSPFSHKKTKEKVNLTLICEGCKYTYISKRLMIIRKSFTARMAVVSLVIEEDAKQRRVNTTTKNVNFMYLSNFRTLSEKQKKEGNHRVIRR